jgi:hypothetical protein
MSVPQPRTATSRTAYGVICSLWDPTSTVRASALLRVDPAGPSGMAPRWHRPPCRRSGMSRHRSRSHRDRCSATLEVGRGSVGRKHVADQPALPGRGVGRGASCQAGRAGDVLERWSHRGWSGEAAASSVARIISAQYALETSATTPTIVLGAPRERAAIGLRDITWTADLYVADDPCGRARPARRVLAGRATRLAALTASDTLSSFRAARGHREPTFAQPTPLTNVWGRH